MEKTIFKEDLIMSAIKNGNNQSSKLAQDVDYEEVEALENEVEEVSEESEVKAQEPKEKKKKDFLNAMKSGFKTTGKVLLGVVIGVGGSLAAGYFMSHKDRPSALEEGEVEYYDFGDDEESSDDEEYPED